MARKRARLTALLLTTSLLVTGCWDAIEINDLDLATLVILDKRDGNFSFTVEVPTIMPSGSGSGGAKPQNVYLVGTGPTFVLARDSLEAQLEKPLYLGTVRTLVITQDAAMNDLAEYLFRLREDFTYRQKIVLTTTRERPEELIRFENETTSPGGFAVDEMLAALESSGRTYAQSTASYVEDILNHRGFVVHCVGLVNGQLAVKGYSVFKDANCIGYIPMEESRGMIYLLAQKPVWIYRVPYSGGFATLKVSGTDRKIAVSYTQEGLRFHVQLKFQGTVLYLSEVRSFPLTEQVKQELTEQLALMLKTDVDGAIAQSQHTFQCDYLNFCEAFRLSYPDAYETVDWIAEYPGASIQTDLRIDLVSADKMDMEPPAGKRTE